ncbi:alpha/beta hydrolase fold domain-containing protein [Alteromonas sp. AMM-1]|uniref:alpha/beta hydrolase fold domain-containing protein n=1 Tax=Alteromonas sp. AMM-1 TaxID=3394233 RepID=UPI0039A5E8BF
MKRQLISLALTLIATLWLPALAQDSVYQVDDGYTPGERFARYKAEHPELQWPALQFREGQTVEFERPYKSLGSRDLHIDTFFPSAENHNGQAIIFIHGGGWRAGNKSNFYPLANKLAQLGYTVFTPEYRLSIEAQYPAGMQDITDAILWVKSNSEALMIHPQKVAIGGGSSGGQMAALAGYTAHTSLYKSDSHKSDSHSDTSVNAVIDLDGVLDFTTPLALKFENKRKATSAAAMWLGADYEANPARWKEASAATHVNKAAPPTLVISSGQIRFTAGHEAVGQALNQYGIHYEFVALPPTIHTFWLFEPYLSQTTDTIHTFLQRVATQGVPQ